MDFRITRTIIKLIVSAIVSYMIIGGLAGTLQGAIEGSTEAEAEIGASFVALTDLFDTYIWALRASLFLATYGACTLFTILWNRGNVISAILLWLLMYGVSGALALAFVFTVYGYMQGEFGLELEAVIVWILSAAAMLWAPVFDIIHAVRAIRERL